jgi:hypothetical protein
LKSSSLKPKLKALAVNGAAAITSAIAETLKSDMLSLRFVSIIRPEFSATAAHNNTPVCS